MSLHLRKIRTHNTHRASSSREPRVITLLCSLVVETTLYDFEVVIVKLSSLSPWRRCSLPRHRIYTEPAIVPRCYSPSCIRERDESAKRCRRLGESKIGQCAWVTTAANLSASWRERPRSDSATGIGKDLCSQAAVAAGTGQDDGV